jgi:hypothetical protein
VDDSTQNIPIPSQVRIFYCDQVICSIFILISLGISTLTAAPPPPASKFIVFIFIMKFIRFIICYMYNPAGISTLPPEPANSDDLDLQSLLRKFVPCGLTYEYLVSKNRVDDEDKCTAKWADGSGNVCNRPLGAHHPYAPPGENIFIVFFDLFFIVFSFNPISSIR